MTFDFEAILAHIAANPDAAKALQAVLNPVAPPPPAPTTMPAPVLPDLNRITLVQATYFDNGPKGVRRPNTAEFAITIEAWTSPADKIKLSAWQWKRSVPLIDYTAFEKRIHDLHNKGTISSDYYAYLKSITSRITPKLSDKLQPMFGLIGDKGQKDGKKGTHYYENQFVVCFVENRIPVTLELVNSDQSLFIETFDHLDMKGQPLKGAAKRQARIDQCEFHPKWGTA